MDPPVLQLPDDHPGVSDQRYRTRRAAIAAVAESTPAGEPPGHVDYDPIEDETWSTVIGALTPLHDTFAVAEYRCGAEALGLSHEHVPQLADVSERLERLTGWTVRAVPGLVPIHEFYGSLAERTFLSTQYVRHPSVPFYTPEPDVIHELIGHVNALANPRFASIYEAAGAASVRAGSDESLERFSRVFWFTIEFGVVREGGELRTPGAGLLSSFGEIQRFRDADIRPFDVSAMEQFDYDITHFQDVLFAADSFDDFERELIDYFAGVT